MGSRICALSNGSIVHDVECPLTTPFSAFCTTIHSFVTGEPRDFVFGTREQFLHCGLRKFRYSKSSAVVYWGGGIRRIAWLSAHLLFMTHCLRLNLQLHTISLVRTWCISSFCTVAWQLARLLLTRRIARSLGDS